MGRAERIKAPATCATSALDRTLPSRPTAMLPAVPLTKRGQPQRAYKCFAESEYNAAV